MDRSLRELGIGDFGVPKRMKKMAEAFYGRHDTYRLALSSGDRAALVAAIDRNVFGDADKAAAAELADYAIASQVMQVNPATGTADFAKLERRAAA
jgi:cytochrome b pre-mRNA-processing protein 3